jgi:peptidoglycan/LPS O-acetylase OafA/YrhL
VVRLGVPFACSVVLLAPLAYYPSYLVATPAPRATGFLAAWLSLGTWPAGPAWFLWLLLAFDAVVTGLAAIAGRWPSLIPARWRVPARPAAAVGALIVLSGIAYLPVARLAGPVAWFTVGPFTAQTSRVLLYALYFGCGVLAGRTDLRRGLLEVDGPLARTWWLWACGAAVACAAALAASAAAASGPTAVTLIAAGGLFVVSCASACAACVAAVLRWLARPTTVLDHLGHHAYGIYLLHYIAVTWAQYALLPAALPAPAKAAVVFIAAVAGTWLATAMLRRIPGVMRVL